jgi:hypothetical protein
MAMTTRSPSKRLNHDAVTDLGVVIDARLRFYRQVTKVGLRVYATLHRLRLLKFMTPKRV